jgi:hypothetical protein
MLEAGRERVTVRLQVCVCKEQQQGNKAAYREAEGACWIADSQKFLENQTPQG